MDDGSHYFPAHICVGADEYLTGSQAEARNLANLESFLQRQDWIQSSGLSSPFAVVYGNGDHSGKNWYYAPEQRLGLINSVETLAVRLDHARSQASAYLKEDVYEATIGVPAHFYNDEQWVVREAAMVAGLNVLNITMNPCGLIETAMDSLKIPRPEATVLALEVGASHFTFALATRENGFVDIREHGSAMVGGKDFRLRIFEHLVWIAVQRGMNPLTNAAATHRLRVASEAAKIALSSSEQYTVSLESLVDGQDFFEIITRETFECLCQDLFLSIMSNLDDMDWKWDIHQRGIYYVLIGGESSRIPKLRRLWEEWLWKRGIGHSTIKFINIGHAGAMGLALNAGAISGMDCQAHAPRVSSLMEVATENIGIETRGGIMSKLILRNSTIPRRSRKQFWWHAEDMCPEVMAPGPDQKQTRSTQTIPSHGALQVYEGHRTRTKDNRRIASIDLTQLFAHATTTNVLLEVAIDIDVRLAIIIEVSIAGTQFRIRETMNTVGALHGNETKAQKLMRSDEAETARIEARRDLDRQISKCQGLLDAVSTEVDPRLMESFMSIELWAEGHPDARLSHFVAKRQELKAVEAKINHWWEAKTSREMVDRSSNVTQGSGQPGISSVALGSRASRTARPGPGEETSREIAEPRADEGRAAVTRRADDADVRARPSPIVAKEEAPKGTDDAGIGASGDAKGEITTERPGFKSAVSEVGVASGPASSTPGGELEPSRAGGAIAKHEALIVDSDVRQHEETVMKQPKPRSADESEAESSVRGTTLPSGTDSATVASSGLDAFFSSTSMVGAFTDTDFYRVSTYLRNTGNMAWSTAPRLYTVLRVIDQLDAMEVFLRQGINDMWFPFTNRTLPAALQPSIQAQFLDRQEMAYSQSKTFQLESGEQKHAYFSKEDPLPFRVIARLGRGAHGSVDKVMSNFSQREYARKLFRKSRGLRAEDVQAFKTELGILKRVTHRHCVSLVATYSDPKYFALLMEPVGDYNLAEYYTRCRNEPDKHSLMRGFFGCLVSAVQYLHDSKVRHRDIKPQNIIVRSDQVLLADFGIAHSWENLTRATTTADSGKTMTYAAPEVIRVEPRNTAADMWSLGCIFLEIVTVLKAKTTQELRTHFIEHSDTPAFHANTESTQIWAEELRRLAPAGDNAAVGWALDMLQHNQHARPTAASLFEEILRESISCGTLFCGTCCDGVESTEGEEDDEHLWGDDGL
ncbi:hypothetical protein PLIIFM63780_009280 [Purpureocillium lilacinum]|nr:hypothetical protein PLIIFM63780_009280 [Purpureocillium lilacinum]